MFDDFETQIQSDEEMASWMNYLEYLASLPEDELNEELSSFVV